MSEIIDNKIIKDLGDFSQDIFFNSHLFKNIKKVDYNITEYSGFNRKLWEKIWIKKKYYVLRIESKRKSSKYRSYF